MKDKNKPTKAINLALQGGGSHGAFTWGVLDYFLDQRSLEIESISGTSAGAVNAALLISGYEAGGRAGAKQALADFWRAVSSSSLHKLVSRSLFDHFNSRWSLDDSPAFLWFDLMTRVTSPYQINPLNINPLKTLLQSHIDFNQLNCCTEIKIFISATNVETGQVKVFRNREVDIDVVLASTCLPLLFQAVEIENIPYWDGGFMGNPILYPFYYECDSRDIVIVKINPFARTGTPKTAREILNRMDEINFNSSLIKDLRSIRFVQKLLAEHKIDDEKYKAMLIHVIDGDEHLLPLSASSKFNTEWDFIEHLYNCGREIAEKWFKGNRKHLGKKSSFDLDDLFDSDDQPD